jgi:hypothetical protein
VECQNCGFVASPGQAAVQGSNCPNCQRPYRDQPTPLNSEMEMRDMPAPGEEDTGGNPLQEGVLGDFQNRGVRDEAFASVHHADFQQKLDQVRNCPHPPEHQNLDTQHGHAECADCGMIYNPQASMDPDRPEAALQHPDPWMDNEPGSLTLPQNWAKRKEETKTPDFEVVDVLPPDPDSIRLDKEQMDKQAGILDTLGDIGQVAAPIAGGVGGFMLGGPAGAALGAGLAGGGMDALNGGNVGDVAQTGLTDAALGGLGGMGAGAAGLEGGAGFSALKGSIPGLSSAATDSATAAEQGATKGGVGSWMKSAWGKVPTGKIQNAYMMHSLMGDAGNQMQQATQPDPSMMGQPAPASIYSAVETPTSHGEIPSNDTSDPEEVDFHENEDKKNPLSEMDINNQGGTDQGPDNFFMPDSGALSSFAEMLPKILEYATSDQSAAGDPDMEELHQKLEAEAPGYMNQANDDDGHKLMVFIMGGGQGGGNEASGDEFLQDNDKPHDPISEHEATALRPGLENTCARCGGVVDPSTGRCPQCGLPNANGNPQGMTEPVAQAEGMPGMVMPGNIAHTAAGELTQGPNTDQQKAEVAKLLQSEGRGEEVPTMLLEPWNFAEELAKITQQEEPPEGVGAQPPAPPVPPSQPGEMPVPGMSAPPGGGEGMGQQMAAAVKKYAATVDGFCEKCPKCGSHSTGYMDYENGDAGCKTCGNKWTAPKMVKNADVGPVYDHGFDTDYVLPTVDGKRGLGEEHEPTYCPTCKGEGCEHCGGSGIMNDDLAYYPYDGSEEFIRPEPGPEPGQSGLTDSPYRRPQGKVAAGEDMAAAPVQPELSQAQPEQEQEQNGSLSWTDEGGSPLKVGQTYEMYSQNYDIPDRITVTAVKPDVIEYTINGEYGLSHQSELTHEEASVEGDRFVPAEAEGMEQAPEEAQGAQPMDPEPGQQTDLSTPHEMMNVAKTADFDDTQSPGLDGPAAPMPSSMDNDVTQRDAGQANRLMQMLMKEGFPQPMAEQKAIELTRGLGQHEMHGVAEDIQAAPEVPHPMGPTASVQPRTVTRAAQVTPDDPMSRMGSAPALDSHQIGMMEDTSRSAVNAFFEEAPELGPVTATDNGVTGPDWLMEGIRTAGAHMSPYEQRHYVEESGDARNSDKLQLSGTHYEMDDLSDAFLFGDAGL